MMGYWQRQEFERAIRMGDAREVHELLEDTPSWRRPSVEDVRNVVETSGGPGTRTRWDGTVVIDDGPRTCEIRKVCGRTQSELY